METGPNPTTYSSNPPRRTASTSTGSCLPSPPPQHSRTYSASPHYCPDYEEDEDGRSASPSSEVQGEEEEEERDAPTTLWLLLGMARTSTLCTWRSLLDQLGTETLSDHEDEDERPTPVSPTNEFAQVMDPENWQRNRDELYKDRQRTSDELPYNNNDELQPQRIDNLQSEDDFDEEEEDDISLPAPLPPSVITLRNTPLPDDTTTYPSRTPVNPCWTRCTEDGLHQWIRHAVMALGTHAARHPWAYVVGIPLFSFGIALLGLSTNFVLVFSHSELFTPLHSPPARHGQWYEQESGFVETADLLLIVHGEGENILNQRAVRKAFEALTALQTVPGYQEVCADSLYRHPFTDEPTCWIWSVTQFWDHNWTLFEERNPTDLELLHAFSQPAFPDGIPVFDEHIFGAIERKNQTLSELIEDHFDWDYFNDTLEEALNVTNEWYAENELTTAQDIHYLSHVPAYIISVGFPDTEASYEFQERALLVLKDLQEQWELEDGNLQPIRLDFFCSLAYALEYERALVRDMPLILVIFAVMLGFTMWIFHKYGQHKKTSGTKNPLWKSRASLGIASVVTIGMSLMSGFGLMFCLGIPFTNITLMAPFVILGVGLDDTFIITGAYFRHLREFHQAQMEQKQRQQQRHKKNNIKGSIQWDDHIFVREDSMETTQQNERQQQKEEVVERIRITLQEVGLSVSLTTMTTTFAFVLGCISTIPGIRWLCMYSSVTIVFDFIYQISFFVALLALDERRVAGTLLTREEDGEYPGCIQCFLKYCCCCCKWCCCCCGFDTDTPEPRESTSTHRGSSTNMHLPPIQEAEEEFFMDRIMRAYAKQLLRPVVRVLVILVFSGCLAWNVYSTTLLEQSFNIEDYVPKDSYTRPFFRSMEEHSNLVVSMGVYFRNVDQSDHDIQRQMIDFVEQISELPQIEKPPDFCWVRDLHMLFDLGENIEEELAELDTFKAFHKHDHATERLAFLLDTLKEGNFTFEEKLNVAMNVPGLRDVYGEDIVRDEETGKITASRCFIFIRHLDLKDIHEQINMLQDTRAVTMAQPINQLPENQDELPFFAYDNLFAYWQLYTVAVEELIFTTIIGVVAVCVVGFLIIPNWSAVLFVGPLIIMLYFNLLGTMRACGIYINAVTYVTVVISIGLLVDFLMHILLRYYETTGTTREAKVKKTLETMGASMLLGGFTTWLGVIPMAFSTTKIFYTVFIAFLAMISWGLLIGLVLLPVLLSLWGPLATTIAPSASGDMTAQGGHGKKRESPLSRTSVTESESANPHLVDASRSFHMTPNHDSFTPEISDEHPVVSDKVVGIPLMVGQVQGREVYPKGSEHSKTNKEGFVTCVP